MIESIFGARLAAEAFIPGGKGAGAKQVAEKLPGSPEGTTEIVSSSSVFQPSLTGLDHLVPGTQDYVLGYFQPSLRDSRGVFPKPVKPTFFWLCAAQSNTTATLDEKPYPSG